MIRLSGLAVGTDIELRITGARPGEKLAEELSETEEESFPTAHPSILRLRPLPVAAPELRQGVGILEYLASIRDDEKVGALLHDLAFRRPVSLDLNGEELTVRPR
jgi:FlaA1/EpsC-like NDP-sugar epimerase